MSVPVNRSLIIPDAELEWRFTPSGGPGGQHANRSNTRVELSWSVVDSAVLTPNQRRRLQRRLGDVVRITADEHRSQARNRDEAAQRLAERCRRALEPTKRRRATAPTAGSKRRRLKAKRQRSETKKLRRRPGPGD